MSDIKRDYPDRPIACVGAVVWRGEDVLLIQRNKEPRVGEWSIPGGAQDVGEKLEDAIVREILEETDVQITNPVLLEVLDYIARDNNNDVQYHYTLIDYMADAAPDSLAKGGSDAKHAEFMPWREAAMRVAWSDTKRIIELSAERRGLK